NVPSGRGLIGALDYYGLDSIGAKMKEGLQELAIRGGPYTAEELAALLTYVKGDAERLLPLLRKMLPDIGNLARALHRGESIAALARMEHIGVPIDEETFPLLTDKGAWSYVRDAMVPSVDTEYRVYVQDAGGDWHFSMEHFQAYLVREKIDWLRTETGVL